MNSQNAILSVQDTRTLRRILQITAIRGIFLNEEEIETLLPDQNNIEINSKGYLNFDTRDILIRFPGKPRRGITISLDDRFSLAESSEEYDDYKDWHYATQFNLLIRLLGEETTLDKLANAMTQKYESLSTGQAKAVIMKYIPVFREDTSSMSSTTRTQIHRLRHKLEKYKRVVDAFYPLLNMENMSLENIAEQLAPHQKYTQSPFFADNRFPEKYDVNRIQDIVNEVSSPKQLTHVETQSNQKSKAEIEETRRKLLQKGYDPDKDQEDESKIKK